MSEQKCQDSFLLKEAVRIFFAGLGTALRKAASGGAESSTPKVWSQASAEALTTLYKCGSRHYTQLQAC